MLRGSIPPTGISLPFVSAGGTSVSIFMGVMGVLCNVAKGGKAIKTDTYSNIETKTSS